jgi:acyl dehydratase
MNWTDGQVLHPLGFSPITREQLADYADASGDRNPIHLDENFARAAGFPSVIVHGMLSMAFMADHLRFNFPDGKYKVLRLKARFRKVTFPGDVLTCMGVVQKAVTDGGTVIVTLCAKNQRDEVTTDAEAEIEPR